MLLYCIQSEGLVDNYFLEIIILFVVGERVKPIPVSEFSSHVERLHADRDKLFEMEYEVSEVY